MEDDNTARIDRWLLKALAAIAVIVVAGVIWSEARAHDALPTASAPLGWSYPFSCCSGYDCREVGDGENPRDGRPIKVFPQSGGYRIGSTGEIIASSDTRIKDSPDGEYHWCSVAGKDDGKTICLFVPPKAF